MIKVYGYINHSGWFKEVGRSEVGAKITARRAGYQQVEVGYRSPINNMYIKTSELIDGEWVKA